LPTLIRLKIWEDGYQYAQTEFFNSKILPTTLIELLQDKDPKRSQRVMQAMLQMKKINIEALKKAYQD